MYTQLPLGAVLGIEIQHGIRQPTAPAIPKLKISPSALHETSLLVGTQMVCLLNDIRKFCLAGITHNIL